MNTEIKEKTTVKVGKPSIKGLLEHIIDAYGLENVSKLIKVNDENSDNKE